MAETDFALVPVPFSQSFLLATSLSAGILRRWNSKQAFTMHH